VTEQDAVLLVLTPEQREIVRRLSGQHVDSIELQSAGTEKKGGELRLRWRLSAASGIPRQAWMLDDGASATPDKGS
jgi:hypothetical protein